MSNSEMVNDEEIYDKVEKYIKTNSTPHPNRRKPISDHDFIYVNNCFELKFILMPPLLSRKKLKLKLLEGIDNVLHRCSVIINPEGINSLSYEIYDTYKKVVSQKVEMKKDFIRRRDQFIPNYETLLKKYIAHVGLCEGTDFLSYPTIYLNDVEIEFLDKLSRIEPEF